MQRLGEFLDAINDMVFIVDMNGTIVDCNNAVKPNLGFEKTELIGSKMIDTHPYETRKGALNIMRKIMNDELNTCVIPMITKEGKNIPVETRSHKITWEGQPALISISRNIADIAYSEEKFRQIFNGNQALIAISEIKDGTILDINSNFLRILGYTKDEVIGKSSIDIGIFNNTLKRDSIIKKLYHKEKVANKYIPICNRYGELYHCIFNFSLINIQDKEYLLTSATDISKEKENEYTLKETLKHQALLSKISQNLLSISHLKSKINNTLKLLGEHTNVSRIYIFEENETRTGVRNTYEWCNWGVSSHYDELKNISYKQLPSLKNLFTNNSKILINKTENLPQDIMDFVEPHGVTTIMASPLYVKNNYYGFIGFENISNRVEWIGNDIQLIETVSAILSNAFERSITHRELKESEMRLDLAINNSKIGLWDWNLKTNKLYFNQIWYEMLGYQKEDIVGDVNYTDKLVHPDDLTPLYNALYDHLEGRTDYFEYTYRLLTKSGDWKWVLNKGKVVEFGSDNEAIRYISTQVDIDAQKKTEENLKTLNATKDKLFSIIAHDLRGPIGTIMQISEMLSNRSLMDENLFLQFITSQQELSKATYMLLENLLNWAKFNSDQVKYRPCNININTVINESIATIKYLAQTKNITIETHYENQIDAYADEDMIKIVMRNLISNAIKFTPQGGAITVHVSQKNKHIQISVMDNGTGMSPEAILKVTSNNEFYSTFGTANEKGSGLGIKLCQNFIALNHGKLYIESEPMKGSNFHFKLPMAKAIV